MNAAAPRSWLRDNGLTVALLALFTLSQVGHVWAGWLSENQFLAEHGRAAQGVLAYLVSGAFLSSLFENWESEFLQMWVFVMLTACLFQRGSPESKDPDATTEQDRDPARDKRKRGAPWPVRRGGLVAQLYSHSLGWALLALFVFSFLMHWINSTRDAAAEAVMHGAAPDGMLARLAAPAFWFESFQNWQSEFLSTAVLILLAVWLREKGSPESKAVGDSHSKTA
jgi:membrane protein implicated in regulation of membrane protease activity